MKKILGLTVILIVMLSACASASEVPDMAERLYLTLPVELQLDEASAKTDEAGYTMQNVNNVDALAKLMPVENLREIRYIALGSGDAAFTDTDEIKNIKDMNQMALGRSIMAGTSMNGQNIVITSTYPIDVTTPHKYTAASEDAVPSGEVLSKAFGFNVDSNVKLKKEIEFDILPNKSANVSILPVYNRYTFDIVTPKDGKTRGGTGELYKVIGFCVFISES